MDQAYSICFPNQSADNIICPIPQSLKYLIESTVQYNEINDLADLNFNIINVNDWMD